MGDQLFVPADFAVPGGLTAGDMRLEPLGPRHNAADYAAWTASTGHIQATPGFPWGDWPHEMSLAENLRDLERHARDFAGELRDAGLGPPSLIRNAEYLLFEPPRLCSRNGSRSSGSAFRPPSAFRTPGSHRPHVQGQ
jgi:hypothetical protein